MGQQILKKIIKVIYLIALVAITPSYGVAQPGIKGASCIMPGTTYQYLITGQWDSSSNAHLCIQGGRLKSGDSCISLQISPSMVLVLWNDSVIDRKITVSSNLGNASLMVTGTTELNGGTVDNSDKLKIYNADQHNYIFHCGVATGGSCDPNYTYQWQNSTNQLDWMNIQGATSKDLQYSGTITISTFFRRVTIETNSNILAYSDSGQLMIVYQ
jgi:hypothetical protein